MKTFKQFISEVMTTSGGQANLRPGDTVFDPNDPLYPLYVPPYPITPRPKFKPKPKPKPKPTPLYPPVEHGPDVLHPLNTDDWYPGYDPSNPTWRPYV